MWTLDLKPEVPRTDTHPQWGASPRGIPPAPRTEPQDLLILITDSSGNTGQASWLTRRTLIIITILLRIMHQISTVDTSFLVPPSQAFSQVRGKPVKKNGVATVRSLGWVTGHSQCFYKAFYSFRTRYNCPHSTVHILSQLSTLEGISELSRLTLSSFGN